MPGPSYRERQDYLSNRPQIELSGIPKYLTGVTKICKTGPGNFHVIELPHNAEYTIDELDFEINLKYYFKQNDLFFRKVMMHLREYTTIWIDYIKQEIMMEEPEFGDPVWEDLVETFEGEE